MNKVAYLHAEKADHVECGRILLVEDDTDNREMIARFLARGGHHVDSVANGADALEKGAEQSFDLAIIDLGLPDIDGIILVRQFSRRLGVPVLVLSGQSETEQRIRGLKEGADDYLSKPFEPNELAARIEAILRARRQASSLSLKNGKRYVIDGWIIDTLRETVVNQAGETVFLSNAEFKLLKALMEKPNQVLSRKDILDLTHSGEEATERSVDIQVTRLRKKLETDQEKTQLIRTVRRAGYMLVADKIETTD
ncbi:MULTISPECIES: response regulator transcription factor [unclassified Iodidimonas]|uniref:response regulator transcription factor n=1 Tax=unclassified Iodidimonas TaxID=2626145 RepID=UPI00248234FB|nr:MULTISPECIES: response regulator transcription factor [unclassified Iodidimonas]